MHSIGTNVRLHPTVSSQGVSASPEMSDVAIGCQVANASSLVGPDDDGSISSESEEDPFDNSDHDFEPPSISRVSALLLIGP